LVKDFLDMNWVAAGLEGSDYSLKRKRANWATLAGTNLFTCDITKPYQMLQDGQPAQFHLITAWEVLEHIATPDLPSLFHWISRHLREGGLFIASTTGTPDVVNGVELHQTKMSNSEWKQYVRSNFADFREADLGLKIYQYVRYNFLAPSFLVYRKVGSGQPLAAASPGASRAPVAS
jgi:cyclopropane fatty-acyl-phospholipid synthase-like methyltransferase